MRPLDIDQQAVVGGGDVVGEEEGLEVVVGGGARVGGEVGGDKAGVGGDGAVGAEFFDHLQGGGDGEVVFEGDVGAGGVGAIEEGEVEGSGLAEGFEGFGFVEAGVVAVEERFSVAGDAEEECVFAVGGGEGEEFCFVVGEGDGVEGVERGLEVEAEVEGVGEGVLDEVKDAGVGVDGDVGLRGQVAREVGGALEFGGEEVVGMFVGEDDGADLCEGAAGLLHVEDGVGAVVDFEIVVDEGAGAGAEVFAAGGAGVATDGAVAVGGGPAFGGGGSEEEEFHGGMLLEGGDLRSTGKLRGARRRMRFFQRRRRARRGQMARRTMGSQTGISIAVSSTSPLLPRTAERSKPNQEAVTPEASRKSGLEKSRLRSPRDKVRPSGKTGYADDMKPSFVGVWKTSPPLSEES